MIYQLCEFVIQSALNAKSNGTVLSSSLIKACLKTLQAYLSWIPMNYIFDTQLIQVLLTEFIVPVETRIESIKCFTEIASLTFEEFENDENTKNICRQKLCMYFCQLI
jgi:exportin-1